MRAGTFIAFRLTPKPRSTVALAMNVPARPPSKVEKTARTVKIPPEYINRGCPVDPVQPLPGYLFSSILFHFNVLFIKDSAGHIPHSHAPSSFSIIECQIKSFASSAIIRFYVSSIAG